MTNAKLFQDRLQAALAATGSLLVIGLDPIMSRLPRGVSRDASGVLDLNRRIIDATSDLVVAYKPNFAFYEALGPVGWEVLAETRAEIPPGLIAIADAKRGDIGDTAEMYAQAIFDNLGFDAATVSPYLGLDGIQPFLNRKNKGTFVLCRTSNRTPSLQDLDMAGRPLYEWMAGEAISWGENIGLVVGATDVQAIKRVREIAPTTPFLVPGIGAQGGGLEEAVAAAVDASGQNALVSASRSVIYASSDNDYPEAARREAEKLRDAIRRVTEAVTA